MNGTNTAFISTSMGYLLLFSFGVGMIVVTFFFARWKKWRTKEGFLLAKRDISWFFGGCSIAASWIWAPALFISCQIAYEKGLAGLFWFTIPNVLSLALFGLFAPTIREQMPEGYTLPQFIRYRLGSRRVHRLYLGVYFFYQLMAITVQLVAGGSFVTLLTGIPLTTVMPIMAFIALSYTLISGLEASIVTDFFQMTMIIVIGAVILPITWNSAGGFSTIQAGLNGTSGITSIFDPEVALSFGFVTSIGLIAGSVADQQYWQRSFAVRRDSLVKAFVFGALLFAIVPISLSTLGFIAANPAAGVSLPAGVDASMIGVQTVATLVPPWALVFFTVMLLCGLSSTLDSGLSAGSALWVVDVIGDGCSDEQAVASARKFMLSLTATGLLLALGIIYIPGIGLKHLWWIFNGVAMCMLVPTLLTLYWRKFNEQAAFWGLCGALIIAVPGSIWGNLIDKPLYVLTAYLMALGVSATLCVVLSLGNESA